MNLSPLHSLPCSFFSFMKGSMKPFHAILQKKVAWVAMVIFGCIAAISYIIYSLWNKKIYRAKEEGKENKIDFKKNLEQVQKKEIPAQKKEIPEQKKVIPDEIPEQKKEIPEIQLKKEPEEDLLKIDNWKDLEKFYQSSLSDGGQVVKLPCHGTFPIKMIESLLEHQHQLSWEEITRTETILIIDGIKELDGFTRTALSLKIPQFKMNSERAFKEGHTLLIPLNFLEWEQLISFLFQENQGFLHLNNVISWMDKADQLGILSLKAACLECLKKSLTTLSYEEQDIQQALGIYDKEIEKGQSEIKPLYEDYFIRGLSQPDSGKYYRMFAKHPEIVEYIFNSSFNKWDSYRTSENEKENIKQHFIAILNYLHTTKHDPSQSNGSDADEEAYINFVCKLSEKINSGFGARGLCKNILQSLSSHQIHQLSTVICNRKENAREILIPLLEVFKPEEDTVKLTKNHRLCPDPSHFSPANGPIFRWKNSLPLVKEMGYDGVELACWGDHFEVDRALAEADYCQKKWALLANTA